MSSGGDALCSAIFVTTAIQEFDVAANTVEIVRGVTISIIREIYLILRQ